MIDWGIVQKEFDAISQQLLDASLDQKKRGELQKNLSQLSELLKLHDQITDTQKTIEEHKAFAEKESGELKELCEEEIIGEKVKLKSLTTQLEDMLYPADKRDNRSVFLEIRAGAGGQEAALFAADLFRMYNTYALNRRWTVEFVDSNETGIGGYKELVVHIKGKNVYKFLKFESGVHRVQRVPKTEGAGRVHTSTVTVAVLPEAKEVDVQIEAKDLRIDVYRASGAGGQHVNTTDSAVRITHIPTGVVVTCQDERSQIKNKTKAMKVLRSRILQAERERHEAEVSATRKQQVGTGERSEKIRTYNYPQNRVTDHRVNVTLKKLDLVMEGDLDDLLMPLREWEMIERRKKGSFLPQQ